MAALISFLNIIFKLILTFQMPKQVGVTYAIICYLNLPLEMAALTGVIHIIEVTYVIIF